MLYKIASILSNILVYLGALAALAAGLLIASFSTNIKMFLVSLLAYTLPGIIIVCGIYFLAKKSSWVRVYRVTVLLTAFTLFGQALISKAFVGQKTFDSLDLAFLIISMVLFGTLLIPNKVIKDFSRFLAISLLIFPAIGLFVMLSKLESIVAMIFWFLPHFTVIIAIALFIWLVFTRFENHEAIFSLIFGTLLLINAQSRAASETFFVIFVPAMIFISLGIIIKSVLLLSTRRVKA